MSSSGSGQNTNSGSEENLMDARKRRRMQSNRDSARRSRMRKQNHVDNLTAQIDRLKKENSQLVTGVTITTGKLLHVETENSVLRAQVMELSRRLDYLNEILEFINTPQNEVVLSGDQSYDDGFLTNSWNFMYMNQPIMANDDVFQF